MSFKKYSNYSNKITEGEKYIGKHGVFSSNNLKTRARINTSIPRYSRRESNNNENYKPIDLFQQISSKEMQDPTSRNINFCFNIIRNHI